MSIDNKPMGRSRTGLAVLVIFISSFFLSACKETPGEFTLGEEFIESQTDLALIDTFSVSLSTVILDSVITSGTGNLLVGNYRDDVFGKITSHSYFQIGIPDSLDAIDVEDDDLYDSLSLVIKYNKYSFGDTTRSQKILVHQLTENIEFEEGDAITSKTHFSYNSKPIGSMIYTPTPNSSIDTLAIRISDELGLDLFMKLRDDSPILSNSEGFVNYFHGLVLLTDNAYEGAVVGFDATAVRLVLYTSRGTSAADKISYEFELETSLKQFNQITHDFTGTRLDQLIEQRNELECSKSGGWSFLQGGIGLAIRIDFPSLQEILLRDRGTIMEARLSLSPLPGSYNDFDLPSELFLYESDNLNRKNELVFDRQGAVVTSTLSLDGLYHEETTYSFDVTEYLIDELSDSYVDPEKGLLLMLPHSDLTSRFHRLIVDAQNQNTRLKIYRLSY